MRECPLYMILCFVDGPLGTGRVGETDNLEEGGNT